MVKFDFEELREEMRDQNYSSYAIVYFISEYYLEPSNLRSISRSEDEYSRFSSLLSILVGKSDIIRSATTSTTTSTTRSSSISNDWKEELVALAIFEYPTLTSADLPELLKLVDQGKLDVARRRKRQGVAGDEEDVDVVESILMAFMEGELGSALSLASR